MGNILSPTECRKLQYSIELTGTAEADSTSIRRCAQHPDELIESLQDLPYENCWDAFLRGAAKGLDKPCVGHRELLKNGNLADTFTWKTYGEIKDDSLAFGSGLMHLQATPPLSFAEEAYEGGRQMRVLGVFTKNREESYVTQLGCFGYNITLVTLYDTLGDEALQYILTQTKMQAVVCSTACLVSLLRITPNSCVKFIITLDVVPEDLIAEATKQKLRLISLSEVQEVGRGHENTPCPGDLTNVLTICYTSGTTGVPKGVLISNKNLLSMLAGAVRGPVGRCEIGLDSEDVHLSYLPLAHVYEMIMSFYTITVGGRIGVYSGDPLRLLEDISILRPTFFVSVPRIYYRIHDRVMGEIKKRSGMVQYLFNKGVEKKVQRYRESGNTLHSVWDRLAFAKIRARLGGRVRYMINGGAALDSKVMERITVWFGTPLVNGYGLTECSGVAFFSFPFDATFGHIGGPMPCLEYKLVDLPEIGYSVKDKNPRGELYIRGPSLAVGYFLNPEETKRAYGTGWLQTGDVAMIQPSGAVQIVDRAKAMFKMAQGEYVSPEKVEAAYCRSPYIAQMFVHGTLGQTWLVAVVVPDADAVREWAVKNDFMSPEEKFDDLVQSKEFRSVLDQEIATYGKRLAGFEKVKKYVISSEEFSVTNNLLTPTLKLRRHSAAAKFAKDIEEMYSE